MQYIHTKTLEFVNNICIKSFFFHWQHQKWRHWLGNWAVFYENLLFFELHWQLLLPSLFCCEKFNSRQEESRKEPKFIDTSPFWLRARGQLFSICLLFLCCCLVNGVAGEPLTDAVCPKGFTRFTGPQPCREQLCLKALLIADGAAHLKAHPLIHALFAKWESSPDHWCGPNELVYPWTRVSVHFRMNRSVEVNKRQKMILRVLGGAKEK